MRSKFKVKVIYTVKDGSKVLPRFKLNLSLPFPPSNDIIISRASSVIIPLGPFEKIIYDYETGIFICHLTWTPIKELNGEEWRQLFWNLESEGWEQID